VKVERLWRRRRRKKEIQWFDSHLIIDAGCFIAVVSVRL
jgi:hypothetical protein